jgi:glucokinase
MTADKTALLGDVGRAGVRFALTDARGNFIEETVRAYAADRHTTISAALMAFKDQAGLATLPRRCALAVAGVPRGDTISVTSSRWFVSKAGLTAILQQPPLVINDFAANVWAVSAAGPASVQALNGGSAPSTGRGTFVVLGIESGLGVAAFIRDEQGSVIVLPTEAGHAEMVDDSPEIAPLTAAIRRKSRCWSAETLLSCSGLAGLRNELGAQQDCPARMETGQEVIHAAGQGDPLSQKAAMLFAKALWRFAGNLVLIYGAWDGVVLTGALVNSLREILASDQVRQSFAITGPYAVMLRKVPVGILLLDHSILRGAAEAIRHQD